MLGRRCVINGQTVLAVVQFSLPCMRRSCCLHVPGCPRRTSRFRDVEASSYRGHRDHQLRSQVWTPGLHTLCFHQIYAKEDQPAG